jgi:DNA repair exonuclease SbcCD ATPase subunit
MAEVKSALVAMQDRVEGADEAKLALEAEAGELKGQLSALEDRHRALEASLEEKEKAEVGLVPRCCTQR